MAKRTWKNAVDAAIAAYRSHDYVYLYGAKNVRLTSEDQIRRYFAAEPAYFARYSMQEKEQIIRNSLGHIADDCSGFTGWVCTGDHQYSVGQINNCYKYNTLPGGPTGSILFTTWGGSGRHIGLDVGGTGTGTGLCMHMAYESTDAAIRQGRAGIIFEPIGNRAWEKSGQSNLVSYSGVYSPYQPTVQLWNEIHGAPQPTPSPTITGWYGEVFGKNLIDVYAQPSVGKLSTYPKLALGNTFEVIGESGNFYRIKIANSVAGEHFGYIQKLYCLRLTPQREGTVKEALWLRQNAGTNFKKLCIMPSGTKIKICDTKPDSKGQPWYYVNYNGQYGFCSAAYVK